MMRKLTEQDLGLLYEGVNLMQFIYVVSVNSKCFEETALEVVITWNSGRRENCAMSTLIRR